MLILLSTVVVVALILAVAEGKQHQPYEREELLEAYEAFGVNDHVVQNEFELFRYAGETHGDLRKLMDKRLSGRDRKLWSDTYEITQITPTQINSEEMVYVSYKNSYPERGDWIGAYSPPVYTAEAMAATVPVKFAWCDEGGANYNTNGEGTLAFNMTNLRAGINFHVFSGGFRKMTHQNTSSTEVTFKNNNEQLRPRVVATGDPDVYTVIWSSAHTTTRPVLKWAWTLEGLGTMTEHPAVIDSVQQSELCGFPANSIGWHDMGQINKANMTGMLDGSNYKIYYTFGDADSQVWSDRVWEFHIPPKAGQQPPSRPTTVVLFDDLGRGSNDDAWTWYHYGAASFNTTKSVGHRVSHGEIDAIYHGGDISYAVGYEAVWDFFMSMLSPMSASVLYFTTLGNHEADWPHMEGMPSTNAFYTGHDSGGECSVTAMKMLPQPAPASKETPWWSYDVGLIHFVGMSTEHNYTQGSDQWAWLDQDLANVNRSATPWIVFGGHRSMYINSAYGPNVDGKYRASSDIAVSNLMIKHVEPLLWKYKVNLGFYGHMHTVQRQSAVLDHKVVQKSVPRTIDGATWHVHDDPQATVSMTIGTGGANLMFNTNTTKPEWNEMTMTKWGYALVKAVNSTYLTWEWVESATEEILDRMVITQQDPATEVGKEFACPPGFTVCGSEDTFAPTPTPTHFRGPDEPTMSPTPAPPPPCPPGKYHHWQSKDCYDCPVGRYNSGNMHECEPCENGKYAANTGQSKCDDCNAGTFAAAHAYGTPSCSNCPPGTSSGLGQTLCTACAIGRYSSYGAAECTACAPGKYADLGQSCMLCPSGTYSNGGASTCTACKNGEFSGPGSSVCDSCAS
jgi:hypothetical protein